MFSSRAIFSFSKNIIRKYYINTSPILLTKDLIQKLEKDKYNYKLGIPIAIGGVSYTYELVNMPFNNKIYLSGVFDLKDSHSFINQKVLLNIGDFVRKNKIYYPILVESDNNKEL
jgi:hypothetical protein